ncbi:MAG: Wzz/FepE/Etk N-terminal domain-containing protein, partial [Candidatus Methanomethyliaceae archaeon]
MEEYEVDLRDYFRVIWRKKWIILATFLVALIVAVLASWGTPSRYEAQALYQLRGITTASGVAFIPPSTEAAAAMLGSRELLEKAGEGLIPAAV